jgi:hypothetical protein
MRVLERIPEQHRDEWRLLFQTAYDAVLTSGDRNVWAHRQAEILEAFLDGDDPDFDDPDA